jgi:hypothetical protein
MLGLRSTIKFCILFGLVLFATSARAADDTDTTDTLIDSVASTTQTRSRPRERAKNLPPRPTTS